MPGLKSFIAAVLGGIGLIPGAVLGGIVIGVSEVCVSAFRLLHPAGRGDLRHPPPGPPPPAERLLRETEGEGMTFLKGARHGSSSSPPLAYILVKALFLSGAQ